MESAEPTYIVTYNDGTAASVHVRFMCQECTEALWLGYQGDVALLKVGGNGRSRRRPSSAWRMITCRASSRGHTQFVCGLAYSADGKWLASGSGDGTINLWDVGALQVARSLTGDQAQSAGWLSRLIAIC